MFIGPVARVVKRLISFESVRSSSMVIMWLFPAGILPLVSRWYEVVMVDEFWIIILVTSKDALFTVSLKKRVRTSLERLRVKLSSRGDVESIVTRVAILADSICKISIGLPLVSSTAETLCIRNVFSGAVPKLGSRLIAFKSSIKISTVTTDEFVELTPRDPVRE